MTVKILLCIVIGLSGGVAVGAGFVAFITVLGIIPRLMQLTKTMKKLIHYEGAVLLGSVSGAWLGLQQPVLSFPKPLLSLLGIFYGVFVGLLAAALYEVLDVFPILFKRIRLNERIFQLIMALVFGKIFGSLFHWIFYVNL